MVSSPDRIFFGGFASGLDTNSLIDALIAVQRRKIFIVADRRTGFEDKQKAFSQVSSSMSNLLKILDTLQDQKIVGARQARTDQSTADASKLSVTASSSSAVGIFTVDISALATPTTTSSTAAVGQAVAQASSLDKGGFDTLATAGTFTINGTQFTIAEATASTAESASATGTGVSTTAMLDSAGLTLTPATSGTFDVNGIQISWTAATDTIDDVIERINLSSAEVTASFDTDTDKFKLTSTVDGAALITFSDTTGDFLQAMNFFDGVPANIAVEVAGTDLPSLTDVVNDINGAGIGVTASVVNDSDGRANLLQITSGSTINLGSAGDSSNFLTITHMLESATGTTRTSVRNLGQLSVGQTLDDAKMLTALNASTGSFTVNGVTLTYDETSDSLANIITRINESAAGVTATYDVLKDKLVITASKTGSIAIGLEDVTGNFLAAFGVLSATQSLGTSAAYQIDGGATQYSTSNTVTDAVTGVTLTFQDTTSTEITVTVTANTGNLAARLRGFAEQYNSTLSIMSGLTKSGPKDDDKGVLSGDTTMLNMARRLRSLVIGKAVGLTGDLNSLADLGLNFGSVGSAVGETDLLLFDGATFDEAIKDSAEAVSLLLTGFTAKGTLKSGGTGSVVSVTGTPTTVRDSGTYELTTTAGGNLTMTFTPDDGSGLVVVNKTISPGEVTTTLIPGLTITFADPMVSGVDTIDIDALQEGIAKAMFEYVDLLTRSGGTLAGRDSEMQLRIEDINEQIERMEKRIDAKREFLIRKFARFEVVMQRLNMQQAALGTLVNQIGTKK